MAEEKLVAMRDTRPLSVDVSELLRTPGASLVVRTAVKADGLAVALARVAEGSDVALDIALEALIDGIHVVGKISGELSVACRRCLAEGRRTAQLPVDELVAYPGDEREDAYEVVDHRVDLEEIMRDVIVGALPFNPVCRPDCKGLCPTCGVDRNEVVCGHDGRPRDIRWNALEGLRGRLEG